MARMATALAMVVAVAVLASIGSNSARSMRLRTEAGVARTAETGEYVYAPPTPFLRLLSLGYQNVLADLLWFRAINYFGTHFNSDRLYPWLGDMCDKVTDLDPTAEHVYRFAAFILPWEAKQVDESIAILEKGVRHLPPSWELSYFLGFNYYFFKDDLESAARAMRRVVNLPEVHPAALTLLSLIESAERGPQQGIDFLMEQLKRIQSPKVREPLEQRVRELILTRDIEALESAVETFKARLGRPPADLQELVTTGIIRHIPAEPFKGHYVLDPESGRVSTDSGNEPARLVSSPLRQRLLEEGGGSATTR